MARRQLCSGAAADLTAEAAAPQKIPQEVEIKDAGPCKKHVKVTVDRSVIDSRFDEKYTDIVRSAGPGGIA